MKPSHASEESLTRTGTLGAASVGVLWATSVLLMGCSDGWHRRAEVDIEPVQGCLSVEEPSAGVEDAGESVTPESKNGTGEAEGRAWQSRTALDHEGPWSDLDGDDPEDSREGEPGCCSAPSPTFGQRRDGSTRWSALSGSWLGDVFDGLSGSPSPRLFAREPSGEDAPSSSAGVGPRRRPVTAEERVREREVVGGENGHEAVSAGRTESAAGGCVNLNEADLGQLTTLPGIGPSRAQRIIELRQRRPFESPRQVTRVKGVGPKTFQKMKPLLCPLGADRS